MLRRGEEEERGWRVATGRRGGGGWEWDGAGQALDRAPSTYLVSM